MQKVIGIRFKPAGKIYYFDPTNLQLEKGDQAVVETVRGMEFGDVVTNVKEVSEEELIAPVKPVIRKATNADRKVYEQNKVKAAEALVICEKKVAEHNLTMKLIDAEYTFDKSKIIFYFTADGRVDFRELVKDLASVFKIRIELRQIGVRDETKLFESLGPCGRPICCSKWLGDFNPVSIKMAKDQNLSLNPGKISGICGRLLCCLKFEHETYKEVLREMPPVGAYVKTPDGKGNVEKISVMNEKVTVRLDGQEAVFKTYGPNDVKVVKYTASKQHDKEELSEDELKELKRLEEEFNKNN